MQLYKREQYLKKIRGFYHDTSYQDIKVNNYIKGDDLKANKSQTNGWFFIIPACASILLVMAIIKKRG